MQPLAVITRCSRPKSVTPCSHIPPVKHQGNFRTLFWSTDEQTRCVLPHATTFCGLHARSQFKEHDGLFHRRRVFWAAWFPRMSASSIEHLQLHQFCRWYAALSLFSIRDHSYFFTLVKLSCSRLSDSQGEIHAKCSRGGKKEKRIAAPAILQRAE